ncbi:MAG: flagellar hook-basal body protein [bacterium]
MIVGLYASASGMLAEASRHEAIANNLANVSTTGFKRDTTLLRTQPSQMVHRLGDQVFELGGLTSDLAPALGTRGQGVVIDAIKPNFQQGTQLPTGNTMDFALEGEGFFVVETARGRRYTRQGEFSLDGRGRLVTRSGDAVLNAAGAPITVGRSRFEVNAEGRYFLDGQEAGRLSVVLPDAWDMVMKEGEGAFAPAPGARFRAAGAQVRQGALERSNVNAVLEMAEMLQALRAYEANQRAIMAQDQTLNTLISQVGRFG